MGLVYINLKGGLGNQLFQAALGVALTQRLGVEVRYLAHGFASDSFGRACLLDRFPNLRLQQADPAEITHEPVIKQAGLDGDGLLARLDGRTPVILDGWWQRETFFLGQEEAIREALSFRPGPNLAAVGDGLRQDGAIGVHVRRSDYGHFGLVRASYYRSAVAEIVAQHGPRRVIFFTDEPNFCWEMFRDIPDMGVVEGQRDDPLVDFHLLSRCAHFVIANSSYSWWAAWLGRGPDSVIYAPRPWALLNPADPAPPDWRRIDDALVSP